MFQRNNAGQECIHCHQWVNPYAGLNFIMNDNALCQTCSEECIPKLVAFLNNAMGIINKGVKDDPTAATQTSREYVD